MPNVRIPRQPDLVLVTWVRNPLAPRSARTITAIRVIGSARPCRTLLVPNAQLIPALRCLKQNGFVIVISRRTTDVSGFLLLQRG